jgi:hypothetical protein
MQGVGNYHVDAYIAGHNKFLHGKIDHKDARFLDQVPIDLWPNKQGFIDSRPYT